MNESSRITTEGKNETNESIEILEPSPYEMQRTQESKAELLLENVGQLAIMPKEKLFIETYQQIRK